MLTKTQDKIFNYLEKNPAKTAKQIAAAIGAHKESVFPMLNMMKEKSLVEYEYGTILITNASGQSRERIVRVWSIKTIQGGKND